MNYKQWLGDWLEHYVKPSSKDKTYKRYREICEQHLIPQLGEYEIDEITPITVQKFISELLKKGNLKTGKGLAASSVNSIITVIQASMKMANLAGVAMEYEMHKLKRPKVIEKGVECFSVAEQKKIEQSVLKDKREKMRGIIICLYTGIRIGELLALEWSDIDFVNGEMTINKTCYDGTDEQGKYCRKVDSPKTVTSNRTIPIPKSILQILREMKKNKNSNFLISNKGTPISVRSYQRSFELLLKKLEIKHHGFHSLRHTFATRALECGMDVKTLSEILGHRSPTITLNRYAHSMTEYKKNMMNRIGKLL